MKLRTAPSSQKSLKRGFTMIELLVVATIIIVLSTIGIVSYTNAGKGARDGKRKAEFETLRQALVLHRSENSSYPSGSDYDAMTTTLITGGHLSSPAPVDPKDVSPYVYTYSSDGTTFTLSTTLEADGSAYQVTNP